jgi:hypothetical protein
MGASNNIVVHPNSPYSVHYVSGVPTHFTPVGPVIGRAQNQINSGSLNFTMTLAADNTYTYLIEAANPFGNTSHSGNGVYARTYKILLFLHVGRDGLDC